MIEKFKKAEGENKGLTKYINDMRAVINTSAPSLGEEGTKNYWSSKETNGSYGGREHKAIQ